MEEDKQLDSQENSLQNYAPTSPKLIKQEYDGEDLSSFHSGQQMLSGEENILKIGEKEGEDQEISVQKNEISSQDIDLNTSKCNLHKRPIEVICIDPLCSARNHKCCYKCLTHSSEHSQHKSMDIDEAQEKYREVLKQIQIQLKEKESKDKEKLENIITSIRQTVDNFKNKITEMSEKVISHLQDHVNNQVYITNDMQKLIDSKSLLDIQDPYQFKQAVFLTKKLIAKKDLISSKITEENYSSLEQFAEDIDLLFEQDQKQLNGLSERVINQVCEVFNFQGILERKIRIEDKEKEINKQSNNKQENIRLQLLMNNGDKNQFITYGSEVKIWDLDTTQIVNRFTCEEYASALLQFDSNTLILGTQNGYVQKYEKCQFIKKVDIQNEQKAISGIYRVDEFSFICSSISEKNSIVHINLDMEIQRVYKVHNDVICYTSLLLLENPKYFVSASQKSKALKLWTLYETEKISAIKIKFTSVGMTKLKNNKFLLQDCKHIILYNIENYHEIQQIKVFFNCHQNWVRDIKYLPLQNIVVSASQDKQIKVWKFQDYLNKLDLKSECTYSDYIKNIIILNNKIISTSNDQCIQIWK